MKVFLIITTNWIRQFKGLEAQALHLRSSPLLQTIPSIRCAHGKSLQSLQSRYRWKSLSILQRTDSERIGKSRNQKGKKAIKINVSLTRIKYVLEKQQQRQLLLGVLFFAVNGLFLNMAIGEFMSGSITAAISPLAMTIGFILWGEAWQSSAYALNQFKCTLAGVIFLFIALSIRPAIPVTASDQSMIILSSILGIVIGDNTWLLALQMIGAKRVIVIDTLKPFLAAVLGNWFLNEPFTLSMACGIIISSVGVLLVSLEKESGGETDNHDLVNSTSGHGEQFTSDHEVIDENLDNTSHDDNQKQSLSSSQDDNKNGNRLITGYVFAAINVGLDAIGSVLTKQFGTALNTWEINFLRFGFAAVSMSVIAGTVYLVKHTILGQPVYSFESTPAKGNYSVINPLSDSTHGSSLDGSLSHLPFQPLEIEMGSTKASAIMTTTTEHLQEQPKRSKEDHIWYIFPHYSDMKKEEWMKVIVGIMFVTFLCPALSNYALFQIPLGLCLTLTSLGPVYSIPLAFFMSGERTGLQGVIGALLAVGGVAIMFSSE